MSHPERLLTSQELHNFRVFLSANPHLTHSGPEGAFDAMPKAMKRTKRGVMVPGKQIRVLTKISHPAVPSTLHATPRMRLPKRNRTAAAV